MPSTRSTPIAISLAIGKETEQRIRTMLFDLFVNYPLDKWRYTEELVIEQGVIPHSHPILTLNTQYSLPAHLLADYIHEQLHWFTLLEGKSEASRGAITEFRRIYPDLPTSLPQGCGNAFSNYLHILICYLEYHGVAEVLGGTTAEEILRGKPYYTRIYDLVLSDRARIEEVVQRYGALPDTQPPTNKVFRKIG